MKTPDSTRSILDSLRRLVRELHLFSSQAQQKSGLSAAQLFVLERVSANQPVSINDLAALTLTHQSSVSVVAQKLADRGLLVEQRSSQDARRKELTITSAGRQILKQAPPSVQDRLISAARAMTSDERDTLDRLLHMLIQRAGLDETQPGLFFEKEPHAAARGKRSATQTSKRKATR